MIFFIFLSIITLDKALLNLEKVRGEKPSFLINVEIINKNELERYLNEALNDTFGEDLINFEKILRFLNLIDKEESYREKAISIYKDQAAAFYNPKDHTLKVIEGLEDDNIFFQGALVHELMHSLQDEKLKIYNEMEKRKKSYDSLMAFQSFLEGEALLVTIISMGDVNINEEEEFSILLENSNLLIENLEEFLPSGKDFLMYEVFLPYKAGINFVLYNMQKDRWKGVDKIYKFLPCSMEEILHYGKKVNPPKNFYKLSKKIKLKNAKNVFTTSFGESFIFFLFSKHLSEKDALKKAEGWDGDQLILFEENGSYFILWLLQWDSEDDLKEALDGFSVFAKNENIKILPLSYKKSMMVFFYKDKKQAISPELFNILKKMEVQDVYECKSK